MLIVGSQQSTSGQSDKTEDNKRKNLASKIPPQEVSKKPKTITIGKYFCVTFHVIQLYLWYMVNEDVNYYLFFNYLPFYILGLFSLIQVFHSHNKNVLLL